MNEIKDLKRRVDEIYAKLEVEINTKKRLEQIGFPMEQMGSVYFILATKEAIKEPKLIENASLLYEEVANICATTTKDVEDNLKKTLLCWWENESRSAKKYDECEGHFNNKQPSVQEFIVYLVDMEKAQKTA